MDTLEGFRRTVGVGRFAHPGELGPVGGRPAELIEKYSEQGRKEKVAYYLCTGNFTRTKPKLNKKAGHFYFARASITRKSPILQHLSPILHDRRPISLLQSPILLYKGNTLLNKGSVLLYLSHTLLDKSPVLLHKSPV